MTANIPNLGPLRNGTPSPPVTPPANQPANPPVNPPATTPVSPIQQLWCKIKNGVPYLLGALILVLLAYFGAKVLVDNTEISWFWSSVLVFLVAALIIWAVDGALGGEESPARIPVKAFLIIAFIMSLVRGCEDNPSTEPSSSSLSEVVPVYSDTLDLSVTTFAATKKRFGPGDQVKIAVSGNPVRINQDVISPGEYVIPVTGSGPLVFEKVSGEAIVYIY